MAESPIKTLSEEKRNRWEEQLQMLNTELNEAVNNDRPRLSERIFVGVFLPFFAGDTERHYPQANLTMWVGRVAGNAYREVDIVDAQGQVLFAVPPVFDRSALDPQRSKQENSVPLSHVVASAQLYSNLSPAMGEQHIRAELTKRALVMRVPANVLAHVRRWNEIFTRYGRPPMVELEAAAPATEDGKTAKPGDEPDFEMELL